MTPVSPEELSDHPEFVFIGDHPAIDFVNTLVMVEEQSTDLLLEWSDVVRWLSLTGLSRETRLQIPARSGKEALGSVVELRRRWKAELDAIFSGEKVSREFIEKINQLLAEDVFHEILKPTEGNGLCIERSDSQLTGSKLALALIARQISHFLAEANMAYLHRCANTKSCVLYFYDTTKNHRRQWCSVDSCGNRHKVAEFRRRQASKK